MILLIRSIPFSHFRYGLLVHSLYSCTVGIVSEHSCYSIGKSAILISYSNIHVNSVFDRTLLIDCVHPMVPISVSFRRHLQVLNWSKNVVNTMLKSILEKCVIITITIIIMIMITLNLEHSVPFNVCPKFNIFVTIQTNNFLGYLFGTIAVLIVSALSLVGLLTLPILYKISFKYILNLFTAVAIGTLFGDAMFHLIPSVYF